jgi:hypothetical protein
MDMDSASLYVLILMPFLLLAGLTLARRRRMTQRAAAVLADHPGAERSGRRSIFPSRQAGPASVRRWRQGFRK